MYVWVTLMRVRATIVAVEKNKKNYIFWVSLCSLRYPNGKGMSHIDIHDMSGYINVFRIISENGKIFEKKNIYYS
jgi:hypothetical protein